MPGEETIARQRRVRLAMFRALLALSYVGAEVFFSPSGPGLGNGLVLGLFLVYSLALLLFHSRASMKALSPYVLFLDLVFLLCLVFGSSGGGATLAAISYVFLVLQSRVLHGAWEVLLIAAAVTLIYWVSQVQGTPTQPVSLTTSGVLFLLAAGGAIAFLSFDRRHLVERRIAALAEQGMRAGEATAVAVIQEALKELAGWFQCSHALLAFWDRRYEHYCLCQHPPPAEAGSPALDDRREWAAFLGERLEVATNDLNRGSARETSGSPGFDLAPYLIGRFQMFNAVGCGLYHEGEAIGRLLLINHVSRVEKSLLRRLQSVAPAFTDLALHLLVLKGAGHAAGDRERVRVAQDFHDGPLQSVISFQMRVHTIGKLFDRDPATAREELDQLQELARRQVTEMRTFVNSMRPVEVDTSSLTAAARRLVDDFQKESGVSVTFMSSEEPVTAPGKIGVDILQLIREALTNIHKHAQATHVQFSLEKNEDHLLISVNDNGRGFRFGGRYTLQELEALRLGPNSIKQRMRALGGDVVLESRPGQGASLMLRIPLY
jgi:signal transduction histidine kinase